MFYLKVTQGSLIYGKLFEVVTNEALRYKDFKKWQVKNLPEFNGDVLTRRSPWYLYVDVVGWRLTGEVDKQVWQPIKGWEEYYEPNKRTKAGKAMRERIYEARGNRFNRMGFFDMFGTTPAGREFTVPYGFVYDGVCYMRFDDDNYRDVSTKMAGQFEKITRVEYDASLDAHFKTLRIRDF